MVIARADSTSRQVMRLRFISFSFFTGSGREVREPIADLPQFRCPNDIGTTRQHPMGNELLNSQGTSLLTLRIRCEVWLWRLVVKLSCEFWLEVSIERDEEIISSQPFSLIPRGKMFWHSSFGKVLWKMK